MTFPLSTGLDELESAILEFLESLAEPISEYDLIQYLRDRSLFNIGGDDLLSSDSLVMFRIHFTVYHVLYRMRDRLRDERKHELELSPVSIRLMDYQPGDNSIVEHDPLYEYYMDLSHLEQTRGEDVDEMINRFWLRLNNSERRQEALRELGLEDPVDNNAIRQQYRRLAMKHHPDRGGDKTRLQRINEAATILLNSYNL